MIVIRTANGTRFVNESEVQSVKHRKKLGMSVIVFKDGHIESDSQVTGILYTNKESTEIRDDGLMIAAIAKDVEYYRSLKDSAEEYLKDMAHYREQYESIIDRMYEHIKDEEHVELFKNFVEEMREKRSQRSGNVIDELNEKRDGYHYIHKLRVESSEAGKQIEEEFKRMANEIESLSSWAKRHEEAYKRQMKRNLWERIINKKTYL
jgi:gas vesicle protein